MEKEKIKAELILLLRNFDQFEYNYDGMDYIYINFFFELGYAQNSRQKVKDIKVLLMDMALESDQKEYNLFLNNIQHSLLKSIKHLSELIASGKIEPFTSKLSTIMGKITISVSQEDIINQYEEKIQCFNEFIQWIEDYKYEVSIPNPEEDSKIGLTRQQQLLLLDLLGVLDRIKGYPTTAQSKLLINLIRRSYKNTKDSLTYFNTRSAEKDKDNPLYNPDNVTKVIELLDELKMENLSKEAKERFKLGLEKKHKQD